MKFCRKTYCITGIYCIQSEICAHCPCLSVCVYIMHVSMGVCVALLYDVCVCIASSTKYKKQRNEGKKTYTRTTHNSRTTNKIFKRWKVFSLALSSREVIFLNSFFFSWAIFLFRTCTQSQWSVSIFFIVASAAAVVLVVVSHVVCCVVLCIHILYIEYSYVFLLPSHLVHIHKNNLCTLFQAENKNAVFFYWSFKEWE